MNLMSRTITGALMIFFGIFLVSIPFIWGFGEAWWVSWLYGFPILILGIVLLLNTKEDKIERRKDK
jgi:uncharacterized membrane protein